MNPFDPVDVFPPALPEPLGAPPDLLNTTIGPQNQLAPIPPVPQLPAPPVYENPVMPPVDPGAVTGLPDSGLNTGINTEPVNPVDKGIQEADFELPEPDFDVSIDIEPITNFTTANDKQDPTEEDVPPKDKIKPPKSHEWPPLATASKNYSQAEDTKSHDKSSEERHEPLWNDSDYPFFPKPRGRGQRHIMQPKKMKVSKTRLFYNCIICGKRSSASICQKCAREMRLEGSENTCSYCGHLLHDGRCTNTECETHKLVCPECGETITSLPCIHCGFE